MKGSMQLQAPPDVATVRSFEEFFIEQRDPLFRALWLVTRDRHEAEELTQDAFLKVLERWDRMGDVDDLEAYLFRAAMNLFRNRLRRSLTAFRKAVHLGPPEDQMRTVEDRDEVVRMLGGLTHAQRAALVLMDLVGMNSEEAAKALGVRASTVRVLAARGRKALREQIGETDE
jgi:RNA polymerase sigma-70 factor (ECF subfamily)